MAPKKSGSGSPKTGADDSPLDTAQLAAELESVRKELAAKTAALETALQTSTPDKADEYLDLRAAWAEVDDSFTVFPPPQRRI